MKPEELLAKFAVDKATPEDREIVRQWLSTLSPAEFKAVLDTYEGTLRGQESFAPYDKELLSLLLGRINEQDAPALPGTIPIHRSGWVRYAMAAAAMAVLAIGWRAWKTTSGKGDATKGMSYLASLGEKKDIQLPDGTQVILNGGSELTLSPQFGHGNRNVAFDGEAYFKVMKNSQAPFTIHTSFMNVKVLGTELDVKAYTGEKSATTSLITGKVSVVINSGNARAKEYILNPMEKIVVSPDGALVNSKDDRAGNGSRIDSIVTGKNLQGPAETAWIDNKLVFPGVPLSEVTSTLEKWYGISIDIDGDSLKRIPYTGSFDNPDLKNVLETIQFTIPVLHYKFITDKKLIMY